MASDYTTDRCTGRLRAWQEGFRALYLENIRQNFPVSLNVSPSAIASLSVLTRLRFGFPRVVEYDLQNWFGAHTCGVHQACDFYVRIWVPWTNLGGANMNHCHSFKLLCVTYNITHVVALEAEHVHARVGAKSKSFKVDALRSA